MREGITADYIVVGAGAAGCALAQRLSEDGTRTVLLLEAGRSGHPLLAVPKAFIVTMRSPRLTYRYVTEPLANGQAQSWIRGRALGGSTAINGSMYLRGEREHYDELAAELGHRWAWPAWARAFHAVERRLPVSPTPMEDGVATAVLRAFATAGMPSVADLNGSSGQRSGATPTTIRRGRRVTATAFLSHARRRATLRVVTGSPAVRVHLEGKRAAGVVVADDGRAVLHRARREVVVCGGALETPLLLERSGIGDPAVLRRAGIEPLVESPAVGEGLVEQRSVIVKARLRPGTGTGPLLDSRTKVAAQAVRYLLTRGGPIATGPYEVAALAASTGQVPDLQLLATMLATDDSGLRVGDHAGMMLQGYPLRPSTAGSIHVSGPLPGDPPRIDAASLATADDRRLTGAVLERMREVLASPPLADLVLGEEVPGPWVRSREDAVRHALDAGAGIFHAVGSCAVGRSAESVVDTRLRVRGVRALRVADTSVFPTQPSGGTAAPTMALGHMAAEMVLEDGE
ncbi:GMC family oxidoreductase [Georgenia sp. SYP-B2076]|uniref:GMC family oxidoreductase n=1 Tax=Georgenia sp. SYP-B2076 TaxID=2495881 RepID=UPI000F8F37F2|nr:GMC family oxidoreductase [Georgenia sp. SYP-B2076]